MSQNKTIVKILNGTEVVADTSAAANALVASGGGIVELKNLADGTFYKFDFRKRKSIKIARSLTETVAVKTVSFTAANSTEYSFILSQDVDIDGTGKRNNSEIITVKSDASGTNAEIEAAMKAAIESHTAAGRLKLTVVAGGSGSVILTADAGYPLFQCSSIQNVTVAETYGTFAAGKQSAVAGDSTAATAIAQSGGLITLTTAAAHTVVVGQIVTVATAAAHVTVKNGVTYTGSIPPSRVVAVTGTTMVLEAGSVGSGINTTNSPSFRIVATEDFGQGQDLIDAGIVDSFDSSIVPSASKKYTLVSILGYASKGFGGFNQSIGDQLQQIDLYYDEAATAYATSVGVGSLTLGRAEEVSKGYVFGGTTADPNLI